MITSLIRVSKSGWLSFWRNKWLSSAAILIMSLTIFSITSLLLANVLINALTENLEDKIDISVYFQLTADEDEILLARNELIKLSEVRSVEYVSTDEALKRFKDKHADNNILMQSLDELEKNPLEASLNIKAQQASQYGVIVDFFNGAKYQRIIDKINYMENKAVIARLSSITRTIRQVSFIILLLLAVLAVIVTFNTIRLTIYSARKEIKVMKLVGASNWFVRGPFVIEGVFCGVAAAAIALFFLYPVVWYLSPKITLYLPGTDLFYFLQANLLVIFLMQIIIGAALGTVSSLVAVRRYLKV
ncbi:MAG: permease-like cell division protein FtsX [Patescibacteria group bacterium]|nr:permease-like cell division protein FtsX [Patescibacteria group bacterium]